LDNNELEIDESIATQIKQLPNMQNFKYVNQRKSSSSTIILIVVGVIILILLLALVIYLVKRNNGESEKNVKNWNDSSNDTVQRNDSIEIESRTTGNNIITF